MRPRPLLLAVLLLAAASPATAGEAEIAVTGGPALSWSVRGAERPTGFGGGLGARYGLDDEWSLSLGAQVAHHRTREDVDALLLTFVTSGIRYDVDAFVFVPYVRVDGAVYVSDPPDAALSGVGLQGGVGVDWRPAREWSVGAEVRYHAFVASLPAWPGYVSLQVAAAWIFTL